MRIGPYRLGPTLLGATLLLAALPAVAQSDSRSASPEETQTTQGWLTFSQIDDARDALRARHLEGVNHLVARARATAEPAVAAQLDSAAAALQAGDAPAADAALAEAGRRLHTTLMATELRLHPISGGIVNATSYGSVGRSSSAGNDRSRYDAGGLPGIGMSPGLGAVTPGSGPNSSPGHADYGSPVNNSTGNNTTGNNSTGMSGGR